MNDILLRPWSPADRPALRALWQTAFGDDESFIDAFLDAFLTGPEACVVAEAEGTPVSAMYVLPAIELLGGRRTHWTAGYTYALATLPEYRGRGIGSAVYRAAVDLALARADAACVLPAEEGLYPFYETASGAAPVTFAREARLPREELAGRARGLSARIPGYQYAALREHYLTGLPHAVLPVEVYDLLEQTGTEFFMLEGGVAAAETENSLCRIPELIAPDVDGTAAAASVARWCRAEEYLVRTPLFFDGPGRERPFMLAAWREPPARSLPDELWWGLGID